MFGFHKKKKKVCIPVTEYEYYIILDSLFKYRDKLIEQGKYTDGVDDVLVKVIGAKKKRFKIIYTED